MIPKNVKFETQLFINGNFVDAKSGKKYNIMNPSTGEVLVEVHEAGKQDAQAAIDAAREAFDNGPWSKLTAYERGQIMDKIGHLILDHKDELATIESLNTGKPLAVCKKLDIDFAGRCFIYYGGWCDKVTGTTYEINGPYQGMTFREPVGVVAQIIPWNFPLLMLAWKLGPALASGCTVVMKPSEMTSLSALKLASYFKEAGLPDGVVNFVPGEGSVVGDYLSKSPKVDKVAFTGSTKVGLGIMKDSHAENLKRVTLELGGKSGNIIFEDADLDLAVPQACEVFFNAGQCCVANTRTFVHEKIYDEFIQRAVAHAKNIQTGDPFDTTIKNCMGPLISEGQLKTVTKYIETGKSEGATMICGGNRVGDKGYFVEPTIFVDVKDDMKIAKEEIFGPVTCIFKFSSEEEVIKRVNDSKYGLGAGIVTKDIERAFRVAKQLKSGSVYINNYQMMDTTTPFGGYKDSGIGRELGEEGLHNYQEVKNLIIKK